MLFDEKEVLDVCAKYGIATIKKEGYPLFEGQEMDESFKLSSIFAEPVKPTECTVFSQKVSMELLLSKDIFVDSIIYPTNVGSNYRFCRAEKDVSYNDICSEIQRDSESRKAA